jgi:hypothetical protein
MDANIKRVHYYHADASAIGGFFEKPVHQLVPVQAPLSLPPTGGYATSNVCDFRLEGFLSFKTASTQVSGSVHHKDGPWTTLVTSTVEGLNVGEVLTADRVVAQIVTEHPAVGYNSKVKLLGTRYENLRIAGKEITPVLDLNICMQGDGKEFPKESCFNSTEFLGKVEKQYRQLASKELPGTLKERYTWDNASRQAKGYVLCSVVNEVKGDFPGKAHGNILDIPDFGKVFLGELIVDQGSYRLIMIRTEQGCAIQGRMSGPTVVVNGRTYP